jgi:hypothetical protein
MLGIRPFKRRLSPVLLLLLLLASPYATIAFAAPSTEPPSGAGQTSSPTSTGIAQEASSLLSSTSSLLGASSAGVTSASRALVSAAGSAVSRLLSPGSAPAGGSPAAVPTPGRQVPDQAGRPSSNDSITSKPSLGSQAWRDYLAHNILPKAGCFIAKNINATWQNTECGKAPTIPMVPSAAGNGVDYVAQSSTGALISSSSGSFAVSGLTSETDSILGANYYTLQDDSEFFATTTTYTASLSAVGWEQFIYLNYPSAGTGYAYIQYWLLGFESDYGSCPVATPPGGSSWFVYSGSCYANGPAALVPLQSASNLGSLVLSGYANYNSDDESYLCIEGGSCYGVGITSQVLDLYKNWVDSEFNIFGAGSGSQANLNPGTTLWVSNVLSNNVAASCTTNGYTGETNSLNLGSCYAWYSPDSMIFIESNLAVPAITTSLSPPAIVIGGSLHDTAAMTGETSTAGGSVTYYWYSTESACGGLGPYQADTVPVTDGVVQNSQTYGPLGAGSYSWQAVYNGDANNAPAVSQCEPLTVSSPPLSVGTALSSGSIDAGGSVTDTANIAGGLSPTGTVTFFWSTTDICPTAGATQVGAPVSVAGDGSYPSISQTFDSAGLFYWYAVYSGDVNNPPATSACEPLNVASSSSVTVQVKLTAAEQGATQDAFAVSGCGASVASLPGDGSVHSFTADPSCLLTLSADGSGGSSTAANFPFTVSPPTPSTWGDSGIVVSGQSGGSGASLSQSGTQDCGYESACTLVLAGPVKVGDVLLVFVPGYSPTSVSFAQSVSDSLGNIFTEDQGVTWLDSGNTAFSDYPFYSVVTAGGSGDSLTVTFNSQIQRTDPVVMDVTGTNLAIFDGNAAFCTSSCTQGISTPTLSLPTGPYFAAAEAFGDKGGNVNAGTGWTQISTDAYYMTAEYTTGTGSGTERWMFPGLSSLSFITCASGTCAEEDHSYYEQLSQAVGLSIAGGGNPNVSLSSVQFGTTTLTPLNAGATTIWADFGTTATVPATVAGATGEEWAAPVNSWVISSANVIENPILFYHQYELKLSYAVKDGGAPTAPTLTSMQFGSPYTHTLTTTAAGYWLDSASSWSVTNPLAPSSSTQRWQTSAATSGTVSAGVTTVFAYYHQWFVALSFSISDGSTGYTSSPALTGSLFGAKQSPIALTTTPASTWLDAASWTVSPNPLGGSTTTQRWFATTAKGTISSATLAVVYHDQYFVTFAHTPSGSGSTPATGWYNANAPDSIKATPAAGWKFQSWSATAGITFSSSTAASSKMTVTAAGTVTATFIPNTALSLSTTSITIAPGSSSPVTATVKGSPQSVTLSFSSANPGTSAAFAVNPLTDSVSGTTDAVTISVGSGVAAGTYHITITATGADGIKSSVTVAVKVT